MAIVMGNIAANAGFAAGLVGTIVVGPWTGTPFSAVAVGLAMGIMAMLAAFFGALRGMARLQYARVVKSLG